MKRMLKAAALAASVGGLGATGCCGSGSGTGSSAQDWYAGRVDPCWPERYAWVARQEVLSPFAIHATNGEIIDSTLFNYHFESGTDRLNPAGMEKLDYLTRKRPAPPARLYLETSRDVAYDPTAPDKLASARQDIDARRAQAMQRYLAASTAGRPLGFEIQVVDPAVLSMPAGGPATSARGWPFRFQAGLTGGAGTVLTGAGGVQAAPASSSGGNPGGSPGGTTGAPVPR